MSASGLSWLLSPVCPGSTLGLGLSSHWSRGCGPGPRLAWKAASVPISFLLNAPSPPEAGPGHVGDLALEAHRFTDTARWKKYGA